MIDAAVWIDGQLLAAGAAGDDPDEPTALTGLTVTWGRSTTVDQPEPSTASFDVVDPAGGDSFLGLLYVGAAVTVRAAADVYPPAELPGNLDPSFEGAALGAVLPWYITAPRAARAVVVGAAAGPPHSGDQFVVVDQAGQNGGGNAAGAKIHIPPAPPGDVAAWDDLPTLLDGAPWTGTVSLTVPPGASVDVRPGLYRNAADRTPTLGDRSAYQGSNVRAGPTWQTTTVDVTGTAATAGQWVGLYLAVTSSSWAAFGGSSPPRWDEIDPAWSWADLDQIRVDDVIIAAPAPGEVIRRDVVVFDGRVSEVDAGWDAGVGAVRCSVVAVDFTADLANRDVGDVPWPAESVAARFAHVLASAGLDVPYTIDPTLASQRVSWLDVDRQQVLPLLADLATTVDGVLWSATHRTTGPYLYLADPATLSGLYRLALIDGLVRIVPAAALDAGIVLDAADVLRDPVVFRQSVDDVITRAAVTWQEQTLADDGVTPAPTDRTVTVVDAALETRLGTRRIGIGTQLVTEQAAALLADRVLARLHSQSWRVAGLTWSTWASAMDPDETSRALDLLDGTRRLAAPVILQNLPAWSPTGSTVPLFLQGGTYTFDYGAWTLDLTTASAASQGTSLSWSDIPAAYRWNQFDPGMVWDDLIGVAADSQTMEAAA